MRRVRASPQGFTLIEMMVTLAVIVILLLVAVPSFQTFRQRAALRSASEEVLGVWNQARLESAKRNTWVKFARASSSGSHCVGAAVASSATDTTACNCFETDTTASSYCAVARFPQSSAAADQTEWRGVTMANPTTAANALGTVVIEPKHAFLAAGTGGTIAFVGPPGRNSYRVYMQVDKFGRGVLCQPTDATHKMSDYGQRGCTP